MPPLRHQREDHAARDDRRDLPGHIRPRRMHQQEIMGIFLQAHLIDNPRRHGESRNAVSYTHLDVYKRQLVI